MYTKHRHELRHAKKAWPGTHVDPCLLSGVVSPPDGEGSMELQLTPFHSPHFPASGVEMLNDDDVCVTLLLCYLLHV